MEVRNSVMPKIKMPKKEFLVSESAAYEPMAFEDGCILHRQVGPGMELFHIESPGPQLATHRTRHNNQLNQMPQIINVGLQLRHRFHGGSIVGSQVAGPHASLVSLEQFLSQQCMNHGSIHG